MPAGRPLSGAAAAAALALLALTAPAGAAPPSGTTCADTPAAIRTAAATPPQTFQRTDGTPADDTILGTAGRDVIDGADGQDCIEGRGGIDALYGGAGDDLLVFAFPGPGVMGEPAAEGGDGDDRMIGSDYHERMTGGAGSDVLTGNGGIDQLYDATETGTPTPDELDGGDGGDSLFSYDGQDALRAGAGDDFVSARNGVADTIDCGPGRDRIEADFDDRVTGCERGTPVNRVRGVAPRTGRARTRFLVRFTGRFGVRNDASNENYFSVRVAPPAGTACERPRPVTVWESTNVRFGRPIRAVRVAPARGRTWCRGMYRGELVEHFVSASSSCDSGDEPEATCSSETIIGRFTYRVR